MSLKTLLQLVTPPSNEADGAKRAEQRSLFSLLENERKGSWIMLYGSSFNRGSVMLHSVLVPSAELKKADPEELTHWSGNPYESWGCGLVWGGGKPPRVELSPPLLNVGSKAVKNYRRLVFGRSFDGRTEDRRYFEIAPELTHAHGLHWTPERHAWCRFDGNGDIEDVIVWTEEEGRGGYGTAVCIAVKREVIEMHMAGTRMVLLQMFDSTLMPEGFHGWNSHKPHTEKDEEKGLYYHWHVGGPSSYFRGVQIIRPKRNSKQYGAYLDARERQPKKYESFITQDFKHKRIAMVSCSPDAMASYFQKDSPLPFQTSPVFFNAAVLDKYKADPEKYTLEHRSINCRNSWHLQSYDVNDAGQVHTYIRYLGYLPLSEQVYWKSFNEAPKAGISKRAFKTDFEGSWDLEPDGLRDLQSLLNQLHEKGADWFTLREPELVKQLHYPLTSSQKAWGETLGVLAKLVVEGLERKLFEREVKKAGTSGDPKWASIRWAKEWMKVVGADDGVINEVIQPLVDVQALRTKLAAHSGGEEAKKLRAALLKAHKSPRGHVEHVCTELGRSLEVLRDLRNE